MRDHLATLIDDFRRFDREIAVVRNQGNRRRVTTYGEIARLAGRFAAFLSERGIAQGDRVLLWAENGAEWIAAFHGCLLRGVLAVPLDAAGSADFAARVASDVNPKLAVGDALLLAKLSEGHTGPTISTLAFENWLAQLPEVEMGAISGLTHETPLQILFTSGTTGEPKGVVLTHGNVLASVGPIEDGAKPYMRYERIVHPLRILHTLPLSHVFGQTMGLWVPPIFAAELHFESRLVAPRLVQLIRSERVSVLAAVPRVLALLKAHLEADYPWLADRAAQSQKTSSLRRWWRFRAVHRDFGFKFWAFVSGGGALPGQLEQFWNALGFVLVQGYGMTETTALITLNHPFHVAKGTIGKPLSGREVKLAPDGEVLVRGAMISNSSWQGGALRPRQEEWLETGDIAEMEASGELRFLGRKSEVIVTAAGLNIHPEDIESAIEEQPEIAAAAVVAMDTPSGPEPCAVLACRGAGCDAQAAIERANRKLADFQRISRWVMWPEPDLPRTSTGKVKRKPVAEWLRKIQSAASAVSSTGPAHAAGEGAFAPSADWLLTLIKQTTGENIVGVGDEQRLNEDLHLDSLGRVQLSAAIEGRLGMVEGTGLLEEAQTLGDLRKLVGEQGTERQGTERQGTERQGTGNRDQGTEKQGSGVRDQGSGRQGSGRQGTGNRETGYVPFAEPVRRHYLYPLWPWWKPFQWLRAFFLECVMMPLTWFLGAPRVVGGEKAIPEGPILIVANHITAYDGPLLEYALPGRLRRHIAVAMSGDMLEDYRHWRNPDARPGKAGAFFLFGPAAYWMVTALFNVFPLPRARDFQMSFAHAGKAMDRGYSVMVFPEGARSEGQLASFRPGIGLLVKQSYVPVLPMALRGLGEMKPTGQKWFRTGKLEICIGDAITFAPEETEAAITARLHEEVEKMFQGRDQERQGRRD